MKEKEYFKPLLILGGGLNPGGGDVYPGGSDPFGDPLIGECTEDGCTGLDCTEVGCIGADA